MKKLKLALAAAIALLFVGNANAFNLKDLLGNAGSAVSGLVDGLLTKQDITVQDMVGTWTSTGSAVTFQSEDFLKKAGGSAMAGTIESKLNPYYEKYGLVGSVITISADGKFALKVKGITINGTISKNNNGSFNFTFTPFGTFSLGTVKAYVEKPMNGLNIMFDAKKLKDILSAAAGLTGNSLASTASSLLNSYDGLCVGFKCTASGGQVTTTTPSTTTNGTTNQNTNTNQNSNDTKNKATNALKGILGI